MFDIQQDKCVSRRHFTPDQYGSIHIPTSVAVSHDNRLFYMVTNNGAAESYDIQAGKAGERKTIPNQCFVDVTADTNNPFVFIKSQTGN
mgnify:CR=1 FL=1